MSNTDIFRCKQFEEIFEAVVASYENWGEWKKYWDMGSGGASGKSVYIGNLICFWLPERAGDKALIVVEQVKHKKKTAMMMVAILKRHGYAKAKYVNREGTFTIEYGNDNVIEIESVETSSKTALEDRFKTTTDMVGVYKFIWFEEFTGCLNAFGSVDTYQSNYIRLLRQLKSDGLVFFTYNPSRNMRITSMLRAWRKLNGYTKLKSTIYGLPEKWQDVETLKYANKLKGNEDTVGLWRHLFMGEEGEATGAAFRVRENIWSALRLDYVEFFIQTDEATRNATCFGLYGWTSSGALHLITTYYHSSKETGRLMSLGAYADEFVVWYNNIGVEVDNIFTDSLDFAVALRERGFDTAQSMSGVKDRPRQYSLMNTLMDNNKFKIVQRPENRIMYKQLINAELEYNSKDQPMVDKSGEDTDDNDIHTHAIDTAMYVCLLNGDKILNGKEFVEKHKGKGEM